jgi:hypothetical protein
LTIYEGGFGYGCTQKIQGLWQLPLLIEHIFIRKGEVFESAITNKLKGAILVASSQI